MGHVHGLGVRNTKCNSPDSQIISNNSNNPHPAAGCAVEPWLPQASEQSAARGAVGKVISSQHQEQGCKNCLFSYSELPFALLKEQRSHSTRAEIAPLLQVSPCIISRGTHSSL